MANLTGTERAHYVQGMFNRIAHRYDTMNRLMTVGQDVRWRRAVIRRAALPANSRLLDLGAGTGDLAQEALRQHPDCLPTAADFTLGMMYQGRERPGANRIDWNAADALHLPYPDQSFDAVVSGFLLRNVSDIRQSLAEQYRVLKPGGRLVALDTTRPPQSLLTPLIKIHLHTIIPTLGQIISGERDAYRYLPELNRSLPGSRAAGRAHVSRRLSQCRFPAPDVGYDSHSLGRKMNQVKPNNPDVRRLVVGISGASGVILGIRLLKMLRPMEIESHLVLSPAARATIAQETTWKISDVLALADVNHNYQDIGASIASGSFETIGMVVIPCSIKSLSAIANAYTDELLSRAADVTLKEGRPLLLVVRENSFAPRSPAPAQPGG